MEDRIGSIEVGKLADIAVIDGDLLAAEPAHVGDLGIQLTILGGEVVHGER